MADIDALDLNLLKSLRALLDTRSVSRAAEAIGVSQPAMSAALRRLRAALGDELLLRQGHQMIPTAYAESLVEPLADAFGQLEVALFQRAGFDASTWATTLFILTTDDVIEVLGGPLHDALAELAPGVTLAFRTLTSDYGKGQLQRGDAHLAITVDWTAPPELKRVRLYDDRFVSLVRADHRFARRRPSRAAFARAEHLLVAPLGGTWGPVDDALADDGLGRAIRAVVPTFSSAPGYLVRSELVCTLPRHFARAVAGVHGLKLFETPVALAPLRYDLFWHPRFDRDPGHVWLRGLLREVADARLEA